MSVSCTKLEQNERRAAQFRALASGALVASTVAAACLAVASQNPMGPLRAIARWTLERKGARFLAAAHVRLQSSLDDCGPTALAELLDLSGLPVPSAASLRRLSETTAGGTTLANLGIAAGKAGLPVFAVHWDPVDLDQLPLPSLAWVERRHFVVLARRGNGDSLDIHDPAAGHYRMSVNQFARLWSGAALVPFDRISHSGGSEN